ncbi:type II toxin-antitoxin system YoeB family toxin [Caballeronia hypogeia]|nr:type II toxin-antitoxin system YoeB family toxin [Caballeronia hypogeia]
MQLLDSDQLVLVSKQSWERTEARLEELERELDERKLEESLAWFREQGYTEDKLHSPKDLADRAEGGAGSARVENRPRRSTFFRSVGRSFHETNEAGRLMARGMMFSIPSWNEYHSWRGSDSKGFEKLPRLIVEGCRNPFTGTGKPEPLRGEKMWSRRVDEKN